MGKKLTIRLKDQYLDFVDELRKKNSNGSNYASRSETVRRIISDWAFRMSQEVPPRMDNMVIDEDKIVEVLEDRGYEIEKTGKQEEPTQD